MKPSLAPLSKKKKVLDNNTKQNEKDNGGLRDLLLTNR
jgi:hypothetical protein